MALKYQLTDRGGGSAAPELVIQTGDITAWSVPGSAAIVNAANQAMLGGSGVDGAIHAAAGPDLKKHCEAIPETRNAQKKKARCFTGEAVATPGFNLPVPWIIHTVGPNYASMPPETAERFLKSAYTNSLNLARDKSITHIAFPAISCGIYGFPAQRAAEIALSACKENCREFTEIHFVLNDPSLFSAWKMAADKLMERNVVDDAKGEESLSTSRKNTSAGSFPSTVQEDQGAKAEDQKRAFQEGKAAAESSSPNAGVSGKTKGKKKEKTKARTSGRILLLRYLYSEIEREFRVLPEQQGNTLRDVIASPEFWIEVERELGPASGIGADVVLDYDPIPFIDDPHISVVEFAERGGRILLKPDAESQNDGRTFKQALRLQQLLNSPEYIDYTAKTIGGGKKEQTLEERWQEMVEEQERRLKLDSSQEQASFQKNILDLTKIVTELQADRLQDRTLIRHLHDKVLAGELRIHVLEGEIRDLQGEIRDLQGENRVLQGEIRVLKEENRKLKEQVQSLQAFARPCQLVVLRKLLDKFREKVRTRCEEATPSLVVPDDWNEIAELTTERGRECASLVKLSPAALGLSRYGEGTLQAQAGATLHQIGDTVDTWPRGVYASVVGASSGLREIYQFVFNSNADDDAWLYVEEWNAAAAEHRTGTGTEGNAAAADGQGPRGHE